MEPHFFAFSPSLAGSTRLPSLKATKRALSLLARRSLQFQPSARSPSLVSTRTSSRISTRPISINVLRSSRLTGDDFVRLPLIHATPSEGGSLCLDLNRPVASPVNPSFPLRLQPQLCKTFAQPAPPEDPSEPGFSSRRAEWLNGVCYDWLLRGRKRTFSPFHRGVVTTDALEVGAAGHGNNRPLH